MGKYLHLFSSHSEHEAYIGGGTYIKPYVGYDKEHVHYNVLRYNFLDILYADANGNKKVDSTVLDPSLGYTPIGLCIAKTGFFGTDETARWISLKYMNYTTPESGSLTSQYIFWGNNGTDISTIDNIQKTYKSGAVWGYLTADWIIGKDYKIPSLFDTNGNWNLAELGEVNKFVVTDIDGKNNTQKILAVATTQSDWRTAATITNSKSEGYAPAVCCCTRYHTLGTQAGDWYLGAGGEISMIITQKLEINAKLAQINAKYPNNCISSLDGSGYWSSTEYGSGNAYLVRSNDGYISNFNKGYDNSIVVSMLQY